MTHNLGVDVGGTFTDAIVFDGDTHELATEKIPSTPANPSEGVLDGIESATEKAGTDVSELTLIFHRTTDGLFNTYLNHTRRADPRDRRRGTERVRGAKPVSHT